MAACALRLPDGEGRVQLQHGRKKFEPLGDEFTMIFQLKPSRACATRSSTLSHGAGEGGFATLMGDH